MALPFCYDAPASIPDPNVWYTCVPSFYQQQVNYMALGQFPLYPPLLKTAFDAVWLLNGGTVDDFRYENIVALFHITFQEIDVDGELLEFAIYPPFYCIEYRNYLVCPTSNLTTCLERGYGS